MKKHFLAGALLGATLMVSWPALAQTVTNVATAAIAQIAFVPPSSTKSSVLGSGYVVPPANTARMARIDTAYDTEMIKLQKQYIKEYDSLIANYSKKSSRLQTDYAKSIKRLASTTSTGGSVSTTNPTTNGTVCTMDVKRCDNGTYVGRTGAYCQFVCPTATTVDAPTKVCTQDVTKCADGTWVGRSGNSCQFVCPITTVTISPVTTTVTTSPVTTTVTTSPVTTTVTTSPVTTTAATSPSTSGVQSSFAITPATLGLTACTAGSGIDYRVGEAGSAYQELDQVPWENLKAGDTVRIFYRSTPYRGKFMIMGQGTASAPIRVCGVKSASGSRPMIDANGATTRKELNNHYGSQNLLEGNKITDVHQDRGVITIKQSYLGAWQDHPSYIQVDGLSISNGWTGTSYTNAEGVVRKYAGFGACVWVERGWNISILDNEITNCSMAIYSKSLEDGDFALTKNLRIAGNVMSGNGVVGDDHMHTVYIQSIKPIIEFNTFNTPRAGALGNSIKDRSVGSVIRYNTIRGGAHSIDLVEAEDYPSLAKAMPEYRATYVYGNKITKNGNEGSFFTYGGDHGGAPAGANWGEGNFRKGTYYFFNNTVYGTGNVAVLFQLSTTEERAEVWNNIFAFAPSVAQISMRTGRDFVQAPLVTGGVVNLGKNWINAGWSDSDQYHPIPGSLLGTSNLITGSTVPIDTSTLAPLSNGGVINVGQANVSGATSVSPTYQIDNNFQPVLRPANGTIDLGAVEL